MKDSVKAVILAAGKGTRMKSSLPKVLHKILGKTIIERVVRAVLKLKNTTEIIVITGYKSEEVQNSLKNYPVTAILQEPQLGTGHAVAQAKDNLAGFDGTVLITCGDTPLLTSETLAEFVKFHKGSGSCLTVMSAIFDDPTNYGRIIRNLQGNIEKIVEEKDANSTEKAVKEINAGVYCLDWKHVASAFNELTNNNQQGEYYLTDVVDWVVRKELKASIYTLKNNYEIFGINSQKHLAEAIKILNTLTIEKLMDEGVTFISPENTLISPETVIGKDSIVYPGCVIEGENIIGENCIIGPFAHLRDGVDIASNVRIGNFVEVKKSTIKENTNVAHLSYVGDSVLGKNVNIGAGTITANYNAITKEKSITTIKDDAKIGSNCVLVAPITIEKGANVAAGSVITKDVPEYSLAIARGKQQIVEKWVEKKLKAILNNGGSNSGIGIE
ncbi:MAG: hypothetical protein A2Y25_03515 [Candidatus Melainabacteria bacterium GWF2_37_15]|nr:MAG: hypothetical protein A2Y25_03515 [Candidatus Melainabacteria bacterium GWF2_37_15]